MTQKEVYWIGEIDIKNFGKVLAEINKISEGSPENPAGITLYISSNGGIVDAAIAFYEWIKIKKVSLTTVGLGFVDSSAILVLLAGQNRKCTPSTRFRLHDVAITSSKLTKLTVLEKDCQGLRMVSQRYWEIVKQETDLSEEETAEAIKTDTILDAGEAKKKKLINEILEIEKT